MDTDPLLDTVRSSHSTVPRVGGRIAILVARASRDQKRFLARAFERLEVIPQAVANSFQLSLMTLMISELGKEAWQRGYFCLARSLSRLVAALVEDYANRQCTTSLGIQPEVGATTYEMEPTHLSLELEPFAHLRLAMSANERSNPVQRSMMSACQLLMLIYINGTDVDDHTAGR
jgi:hypothetical protein